MGAVTVSVTLRAHVVQRAQEGCGAHWSVGAVLPRKHPSPEMGQRHNPVV